MLNLLFAKFPFIFGYLIILLLWIERFATPLEEFIIIKRIPRHEIRIVNKMMFIFPLKFVNLQSNGIINSQLRYLYSDNNVNHYGILLIQGSINI